MSLHTQVLTIFQILCLCPPSPTQCCQLVLVSTCWPGAGDTQRPVPGQRYVSWVQCTWASPVHSATGIISFESRHSILSKNIYCSLLENIITNLGKSFLVFCSKSERLSETCGDIREPKSLKIEIDLVFLLLSKILYLSLPKMPTIRTLTPQSIVVTGCILNLVLQKYTHVTASQMWAINAPTAITIITSEKSVPRVFARPARGR